MTTEAPERPDLFDRTRLLVLGGGLVALALVPLLFLGPGTDLDAGAVLRSGRSLVDHLHYTPSRAPGAPVHEVGVGVLDRIGGTVGANVGSLVAGAACIVLMVLLLRRCGVGRTGLVAAVVVANPWFLIAASSTVDFLWALAFLLGAAVLLRDGRAVPAGICAALAIGCRSSTVALVAALVLAEALEEESGRRRAALFASIAAVGGILLFIPSFRASGNSLAFAQNDVPTSSLLVQAGRFAVKDLSFFGPFAAVVLLLCLPGVLQALRTWRVDWLVRFSSVGLVVSQLLFLRYPWKLGHLLPSLVCLALLLGVAMKDRTGLLVALVTAQLLYCLVNVQIIRPDDPNAATGGKLTFTPTWGAIVVDTRCRNDDTGAWKAPTPERADAVWNCAKPWAR